MKPLETCAEEALAEAVETKRILYTKASYEIALALSLEAYRKHAERAEQSMPACELAQRALDAHVREHGSTSAPGGDEVGGVGSYGSQTP